MHRAPVLSAANALAATLLLAAAAVGPVAAQPAPASAAESPRARNLAATCANCHGSDGHARGEMKTLAGVPAERTVALVAAYRDGRVPATIMHQIARGYSDEQIALIAAYFAAQRGAP